MARPCERGGQRGCGVGPAEQADQFDDARRNEQVALELRAEGGEVAFENGGKLRLEARQRPPVSKDLGASEFLEERPESLGIRGLRRRSLSPQQGGREGSS